MIEEKGLNFKVLKENWPIFKYFLKYIKPYWKSYIMIVILSQVVIYLGMISPYITKLVIDNAYANRDMGLFIRLSLIIVGLFFIIGILSQISSYIQFKIQKKLNNDLNKDLVSHIYSLKYIFFRESAYGEKLFKVNNDILSVVTIITDTSFQILQMIPTFIVSLIIVYFLNWKIGLMAFLLGLSFYYHTKFFARRRKNILEKLVKQRQLTFRRLAEAFSKFYLIKAAGKEKSEADRHANNANKVMNLNLKNIRLGIASNYTSEILNKLILGGITFYGGYNIISEREGVVKGFDGLKKGEKIPKI